MVDIKTFDCFCMENIEDVNSAFGGSNPILLQAKPIVHEQCYEVTNNVTEVVSNEVTLALSYTGTCKLSFIAFSNGFNNKTLSDEYFVYDNNTYSMDTAVTLNENTLSIDSSKLSLLVKRVVVYILIRKFKDVEPTLDDVSLTINDNTIKLPNSILTAKTYIVGEYSNNMFRVINQPVNKTLKSLCISNGLEVE